MTSRDGQAAIPRGYTLLRDPLLNKGTAFTEAERDALGLRGLLPPHVATQDEQAIRVIENLRRLPTSLEKHVALTALHDRNETLFFRIAVAGVAYRQGYATTPEPQDLFTFVRSQMYEPKYQSCV